MHLSYFISSAFDEMTFLLTGTYKTLSDKIETQSFWYIATKDSIGFILRPGFITPFCRTLRGREAWRLRLAPSCGGLVLCYFVYVLRKHKCAMLQREVTYSLCLHFLFA